MNLIRGLNRSDPVISHSNCCEDCRKAEMSATRIVIGGGNGSKLY